MHVLRFVEFDPVEAKPKQPAHEVRFMGASVRLEHRP